MDPLRILSLLLLIAPAPSTPVTARELVEAGHYKRARAMMETPSRDAKDAEAAFVMSSVKHAYGDMDAAIRLARQAADADGSKSEYLCQLAKAAGDKAQHAGMFESMRLARTMHEYGEKALSLDPRNADCLFYMMEFYHEAPGMVGGDKNKAREYANRILAIDGAKGNLALAELASEDKKPIEEIGSYYEKAVKADARNLQAKSQLASLYVAQKKYSLAEAQAKELLKLDESRMPAYSLLAQLYALQERWADLDNIILRAEKSVPDNLNPEYQAARVLYETNKDLPRAEKYMRKYLTMEPEGEAPHTAAAHWRLGLVLEKEDRKAEALNEVRLAVSLKPDFEPAKKDLKRMGG